MNTSSRFILFILSIIALSACTANATATYIHGQIIAVDGGWLAR